VHYVIDLPYEQPDKVVPKNKAHAIPFSAEQIRMANAEMDELLKMV